MANPPDLMPQEDFVRVVTHVIRERKTAKTLSDPAQCAQAPLPESFGTQLQHIVENAGYAPFHKAVHKEAHLQGAQNSPVPWRFYVLEKPACCALLARLRTQAEAQPEGKWAKAWGSKIPKLLAGSGALIQVTWLPDPTDADAPALTDNNIEHIAAASATVQNLMLLAEAHGMYTYWASGGILGDKDVFGWLNIPQNQKLLGAIFVTPHSHPHEQTEGGAMRDKRGETSTWATWLPVDALQL